MKGNNTSGSAIADMLMAEGEKNPALGFVTWVLSAFAVSVEVFLRRDFGERYFTRTKFVLGMLVLSIFYFSSRFSPQIQDFSNYTIDPETGQAVLKTAKSSFNINAWFTYLTLLSYIILGTYHTLKIWWRNGTGRPLHSRDHGLTWLEPVAALTLAIPNLFIGLIMRVYALTLPEHERAWLMNALPFIRDTRGFAEKVLEPLTILLLGGVVASFGASSVSMWLYFSSFALFVFTTIRHEQDRTSMLDMRDQQIEAKYMSNAMYGDTESLRIPYETKKALFEVSNIVETSSPEAMEAIRINTPNIAEAMEALNPKLKGILTKEATVPQPTSTIVNQEEPFNPVPPIVDEPPKDSGLSIEDAFKNLKKKE
jgi:hypothetical protein